MTIERSDPIKFHEQGTLDAVTRWIASHAEGLAEWMKNIRRQYQPDRAAVADNQRVATLLLRDADGSEPARIGILDVGGATLEDVTYWSTWQDPTASRRSSALEEEQTQGNGGKAYMFRMFKGQSRILGIRDGRRNCRGFEGPAGTVERGTPGWIPTDAAGRDVEITSVDAELREALRPYSITPEQLPSPMLQAIRSRGAFTLVEGENPVDLYKGRIDADDVIARVVRHEQATLCLQQVDFYAIHNRRLLNDGKKLTLPVIQPYPGLDQPFVWPIPEQLPLSDGQTISTTESGVREPGRLTLHTSAISMPSAWRYLRPRWQIAYRTKYQMIGSKSVGEIAPGTSGAMFVYGTAELPALEPAYVEHGRKKPKEGPLMEALDRFIAEKIREVARLIAEKRKSELDQKALSEVHQENRKLDEFKNRFLPNVEPGSGGPGNDGPGPPHPPGPGPIVFGTTPDYLEYSVDTNGVNVGKGVQLNLRSFMNLSVRDSVGKPVRAQVEWTSSDPLVAEVGSDGTLIAHDKGSCTVVARVKNSEVATEPIPVRVWNPDHVLLTPRSMDILLGNREQIVAEVTDDEGNRSTEVVLDWRHDAEDTLIVRISRLGVVTGNRLGRTGITAGAGAVWARIPVEVRVLPNPKELKRGSGFPRLLLTGRDVDPTTGTIRDGDPDQPPLWQEPVDFINNVWWLNLQNPEPAFAFQQRGTNAQLWRTYHASKVVEMVVQVWMSEQYTRKGDAEKQELWVVHRADLDRIRVQITQEMWKALIPFVESGANWTPDAPGE